MVNIIYLANNCAQALLPLLPYAFQRGTSSTIEGQNGPAPPEHEVCNSSETRILIRRQTPTDNEKRTSKEWSSSDSRAQLQQLMIMVALLATAGQPPDQRRRRSPISARDLCFLHFSSVKSIAHHIELKLKYKTCKSFQVFNVLTTYTTSPEVLQNLLIHLTSG